MAKKEWRLCTGCERAKYRGPGYLCADCLAKTDAVINQATETLRELNDTKVQQRQVGS